MSGPTASGASGVGVVSIVSGRVGAVAAAHPLAASAALAALDSGGCAVDAAIAAHAVTCVVLPHAAGLGGDLLALVHTTDAGCLAVNGCGAAPSEPVATVATDGGSSVTVPGLVSAWVAMHQRWGRLPLDELLAPAIALARSGHPAEPSVRAAAAKQRARLDLYGARGWPFVDGTPWRQPELANLLEGIVLSGDSAFYAGEIAAATAEAVRAAGGTLSTADLARHTTEIRSPLACAVPGGLLFVQPAPTQGVILARSLDWLTRHEPPGSGDPTDHLLIEVLEAAFGDRDSSHQGEDLLQVPLDVNRGPARRQGGARGYLHTAATAVADKDGMTVSSLISGFDQFGSGVLVPAGGFVLNNRAAGFTAGANAYRPGGRPVHTLAPALLTINDGTLALATPGADGQVQTLLQVIVAMLWHGVPLDEAIARPRWRSVGTDIVLEEGHAASPHLTDNGHVVQERPPGDELFGAVAAAGCSDGVPFSSADWRRTNVARAI